MYKFLLQCQAIVRSCCPGLRCVYQRCRLSAFRDDLREYTLDSMRKQQRLLDKFLQNQQTKQFGNDSIVEAGNRTNHRRPITNKIDGGYRVTGLRGDLRGNNHRSDEMLTNFDRNKFPFGRTNFGRLPINNAFNLDRSKDNRFWRDGQYMNAYSEIPRYYPKQNRGKLNSDVAPSIPLSAW